MDYWDLVSESDFLQFAHEIPWEYVLKVISGPQDLSRKLGRVESILSGLGITPRDSE